MLWANRDEFRARPAAPLGRWSDDPELVGGRDLQEGGAWMLLSTKRRLAAVTNVRRAPLARGARSRGHLVRAFVDASASAPEWLAARDDELFANQVALARHQVDLAERLERLENPPDRAA